MSRLRPAVATLLLPLLVRSLPAQSVEGRMVQETGAAPVPGAFVILTDTAGVEVARALTQPDGRFTLGAPGPGRYRLTSAVIGWHATTSPSVRLDRDATLHYTFVVRPRPVQLDALVVTGERRCAAVSDSANRAVTQGARIVLPFRRTPSVVAEIEPEIAPLLRQHPLVDYIEPVGAHVLGLVPGGSHASSPATALVAGQVIPDNINKIRAPDAWPITRGEERQVVILDNGVPGGFLHHADLLQLDPYGCLETHQETDSCEDDRTQSDFFGHAISVAGVAIAADNTIDVVGVAPDPARWVSIRVCIGGACATNAEVAALQLIRNNFSPKNIINMSFGGPSFSQTMATEVSLTYDDGHLMFALAGNLGVHVTERGEVAYPARYSQVIAVSGTTIDDAFHTGSASGPEVEVSAPYEVLTLAAENGTRNWEGTSFSAPAAAGVAALVWSKNPAWSNVDVRSKLQDSVEDLGAFGRDEYFGYGRIDACFAVDGGCQSIYPLSASIAGPTKVPAGEYCTWQAVASGAKTPYTYQWSGVLSGNGSSVTGALWSSGWLFLEVISDDGQQENAQLWITVDSDAWPCPE